MSKETALLALLLLAAVFVVFWQRKLIVAKPFAGGLALAVVVSLATLLGLSVSREGMKGGSRERPVRVSAAGQQGDLVPGTLVVGDTIYYAAVDKEQNKHRVYRYEPSSPPSTKAVGDQLLPAPPTTLLVTKHREPRLFVGCKGGLVYSHPKPASATNQHYEIVEPASATDKLIEVTGVVENGSGVYLLGKTVEGPIVVCRIADDAKTYQRLPDVHVTAKTAEMLLVDRTTDTVAFTYSGPEANGIAAWRYESSKWTPLLRKEAKDALIPEATICRGKVYFTFAEQGNQPRLWSNSASTIVGVPRDVEDAAHMITDDDQIFVAGKVSTNPTVFLVRDPTSIPLPFKGASAPTAVHDIRILDGMAHVLSSNGAEAHLWTSAGNILYHQAALDEFDAPPRLLTSNGRACLVDAASIFVIEDKAYKAKEVDTEYPASHLLCIGSHYVFVAKTKGESPVLTLFSSYLQAP